MLAKFSTSSILGLKHVESEAEGGIIAARARGKLHDYAESVHYIWELLWRVYLGVKEIAHYKPLEIIMVEY